MRRPPVVLGMAGITILALLVAVGLILFQVNPSTESNERSIERQARELADQQERLQGIICAQAQTTANAFRFRSLTPSGEVETVEHFLVRIQAQQQTLKLSRGLGCESNPGFPPFGDQVRKALKEIAIILSYYNGRKEPVSAEEQREGDEFSEILKPSPLLPSYVPGSGRGVGEEGLLPAPSPSSKGINPDKVGKEPSGAPMAVPAGAEQRPRETPPVEVEEPQEPTEGPKAAGVPPLPDVIDKVKDTVGKVVGQSVDVVEEPICSAIRELHALC